MGVGEGKIGAVDREEEDGDTSNGLRELPQQVCADRLLLMTNVAAFTNYYGRLADDCSGQY